MKRRQRKTLAIRANAHRAAPSDRQCEFLSALAYPTTSRYFKRAAQIRWAGCLITLRLDRRFPETQTAVAMGPSSRFAPRWRSFTCQRGCERLASTFALQATGNNLRVACQP